LLPFPGLTPGATLLRPLRGLSPTLSIPVLERYAPCALRHAEDSDNETGGNRHPITITTTITKPGELTLDYDYDNDNDNETGEHKAMNAQVV